MVGDFLFKSSDHELRTSHQLSVSRPVPRVKLKKKLSKEVVVVLGDS